MKILLLGMNHHSAPVDVREQFAPGDPGPLLRKLVTCDEIEEAVLISTCNRVELVVSTHQPDAARLRMAHFFERELANGEGLAEGRFDDFVYRLTDAEATQHVFRVASAIDSMVVGEPQILGQMKEAYRLAVEEGACGPVLSRMFQRAFSTAKRVKTETRISEGPVSIARVAVDLAAQIFEDFGDKKALLIGAGEMIEMALFALRREGLGHVRIANRTREHAHELAERFGATDHGLDEIDQLLCESDMVLSCIGGTAHLLTPERLRPILRARRSRPIFIIDLGVPRNVDPDVNELDGVYLYDVDDLEEVAGENARNRRRESERGGDIVAEEQQRFDGWLVALQAVPTIRHLRARAEAIRTRELERSLERIGLDETQIEAIEHLTRAIVNKLMHPPLSRLRAEKEREEGLAMMEAARVLFALDDRDAPGADADAALRATILRETLDGVVHSDDDDAPDSDEDPS